MKKNHYLQWIFFVSLLLLLIDSASAISFNLSTENNNTYFNRNFIIINVSTSASEAQNVANITLFLYNSSGLVNLTNRSIINGTEGVITGFNFTNLNSNMVYWYNATVLNESGSANSSVTRKITLDSTVPTINFISPTENNNTYFNRAFIKVNVSVVETNEENITFYLFNSSTTINSTNRTVGTRETNFTGLNSNMVYWYNVTVYDSAGNRNSSVTRKMTLDSTTPIITLTYPTQTSYTRGDYILFTTSDTNPISRKWSLDGGKTNYTSFVDTDDIDTQNDAFSGLGNTVNIVYRVNDSAGNSNTTTFANMVVNPYIGNAIITRAGGGVTPTTVAGQPLGAKPDMVKDAQKVVMGNLFGIPNIMIGLIAIFVAFVVVAKPEKKRRRSR